MIRFKILVLSHGIQVTVLHHNDRKIIQDFYGKLSVYDERFIPNRGLVRTLKHTFATFHAKTNTYGLHRGMMSGLMEHLDRRGVLNDEVVTTFMDEYDTAPAYLVPQRGVVPRDRQPEVIDFVLKPTSTVVLPLQTGVGKDQPLTAKIKVPGGWSTMGDMEVGTEITAADGTTTEVIGVHPQGVKPVWKITFADGRSTLAGAEHLWKVYYINTSPVRRWRVVTTLEMLRLISMPNPRVYVPLCKAEHHDPEIDLPIPPYTLGCLLGDGGITTSNVTLCKNDLELFQNIRQELLKDHTLEKYPSKDNVWRLKANGVENKYRQVLSELGLMGKGGWVKFIPKPYLNGSIAQRYDLLQGLMDTDGEGTKNGSTVFSTSSEQLASDVQYLVRSLGGIAKVSSRIPKYTYKGQKLSGRRAYRVSIRMEVPSLMFRLARKQDRVDDNNQYAHGLKLRVKSVEPAGSVETQCISVKHPDHLYVTDDFIVTHNTFMALYAATRLQVRTAVVMGAMHIDTWKKDADWILEGGSEENIRVIKGGIKLRKLIAEAKADKLNSNILLFSINTLRDYLTDYEKNGTSGYGCEPKDLWALLGVGLRITDESHENLHFHFRLDIETHSNKVVFLSATLKSNDPFINKMYETIYPLRARFTKLEWKKYIRVEALGYGLLEPQKVRYKGHGGRYNQIVYEDWLRKKDSRLINYFKMIHRIATVGFLNDYQPGQKLLIFFSSKAMCEEAAIYLRNVISDKTIHAYTGDHDTEILHTNDIVCTTLGSAGTGKDIDGLTTVIMTTALVARERNIQVLGRLRNLESKFPGVTPRFYYVVCRDIDKHVQYHKTKQVLFQDFAKEVLTTNTAFLV